jgi:hypothetical protein
MRESDLHWLAGLLEGEGSFCKPAPSAPNRPYITANMTDEDVIARVAGLFGVSYSRARKDPRNQRWRPSFVAQLRGARAVDLMRELRPLMGTRRKAQIDSAVAGYVGPRLDRKINRQQAREILDRFLGGERAAEIAKEFGVSTRLVYAIREGRRSYAGN